MQRIDGIVETFYGKVEKDPKLNSFFVGKNMITIKKIVAEHMKQICSNPNLQFSPRIKKGHANFQINDIQFNQYRDVLTASMKEFDVDPKSLTEIVQLIEKHRKDVVTVKLSLFERLGKEKGIETIVK